MSITTKKEKTNSAIAYDIKNKKYIYLSNSDSPEKKEYMTTDAIIPYFDLSKKKKSIRIFISGSTGSGKTYLCERILETTFRKSPQIYLFSAIFDEDYSKIKNLLRVDIADLLLQNKDMDIYELLMPDSVCIFDDILSFPDKIAKLYLKLRSQCLSIGRHKNISTICIEQQPRNYTKSRDVLLNSEVYIFFPKSSYMPFEKTCKEYLGLKSKQIEELGKDSRYISINKVYPSYAVREKQIDILN